MMQVFVGYANFNDIQLKQGGFSMSDTKQTFEIMTTQMTKEPDYQKGLDIGNAGPVYHEGGLDTTEDGFRTEELKAVNKHATNSLVARMLWGHEEKVSVNVRVAEDGTLDLNDDVR